MNFDCFKSAHTMCQILYRLVLDFLQLLFIIIILLLRFLVDTYNY